MNIRDNRVNMVTCQIDKTECILKANGSVFQCHFFMSRSNAINQVHMNLLNLDQSTMGQLS